MIITLNLGRNEYADFLKHEVNGVSHVGTGTAYKILDTEKRLDGGANIKVQILDDDSPEAISCFENLD